MPDKLTDSEIVKAFECCYCDKPCRECPYYENFKCTLPKDDTEFLPKKMTEIINRLQCERNKYRQKVQNQREEINRLQAENEKLKGYRKDGFFNLLGNCLVFSKTLEDYNDMRKGLKAKGYKECIEKVSNIITEIYNKHIFGNNDLEAEEKDAIINFSDDVTYAIGNLLKELVGE